MPEEMEVGCARPTGGPVGEDAPSEPPTEIVQHKEAIPMIQVGKKAPGFTAPGYQQGRFISLSLSDYLGKWVLICFYPGDFTFV